MREGLMERGKERRSVGGMGERGVEGRRDLRDGGRDGTMEGGMERRSQGRRERERGIRDGGELVDGER